MFFIRNRLRLAILLSLFLSFLTACAGQDVSFRAMDQLSSIEAGANDGSFQNETDTDQTDPTLPVTDLQTEELDCRTVPGSSAPILEGIHTSVYHSRSAGGDTSIDWVRYGTRVSQDYVLDEILLSTRSSTEGYVSRSGVAIRGDSGQLLETNFALEFYAGVTLGPNDAPGYYQFAAIGDDGFTLSLLDNTAAQRPIVSAEGVHGTQMACAAKAIYMKPGATIPMRMTYFQGPAAELAVALVWRRLPDKDAAAMFKECGTSDFFGSDRNISASLQAKGWKVLEKKSFVYSGAKEICVLK